MSRYNKFLIALIPVVLAGLKVVADGLGDGIVSTQEWLAAVVAALTAYGVFQIPNFPSPGQRRDPDMSEQAAVGDEGYTPIEMLVGVVCFVILVLVLLKVVERI